MREYSSPSTVPLPTRGSLADDVVRNAELDPGRVAFCRREGTTWVDVTAAEFRADVRRTAKGFLAAGLEHGDRVLVMAGTRYEWTVVDYALWYVGAVGVPVYESSTDERLARIVGDSEPRAAVVGTAAQEAAVRRCAGAPDLVWVLDARPGALAELATAGAARSDEALERRRADVGPGDLATVIYTSGTTGTPKGCQLSHRNLMAELDTTLHELRPLFEDEDAATLLLLPMAHVFARVVQVGAVRARVRLAHSADVRRLSRDLEEFQPTFVVGVPRVFERLFNSASQRAVSEGRGRVFARATEAAIAYSTASETGRPNPWLRARHAAYDRLVYQRFRASLGGRCRAAISGGAPLGERLGHFFRGVGVPVFEGYGLTETTGAVTLNSTGTMRVGSAGRPLPGTAVRVSDDGELLVRGPQVMHGYRHAPEVTATILDADGWLHTGDLGEIDAEGFVRVVGRRNEILVTAGGKTVSPSVLEDRVRAHHLVGQCLVVGDGRPYVAALVTLDPETVAEWAARNGKGGSLDNLAGDPLILEEVQGAVDEANRTVSRAEWIRRFDVLPVAWSEETGELTPSLRLRRHAVLRRYRDRIEALYD